MPDAGRDILRGDFPALFEDVTVLVTSSFGNQEILDTIVRRTAETFGVWECDLYEYAPAIDAFACRATWGVELTPEHLDWVGAAVEIAEHPSYRAIVDDRRLVEYVLDDPSLPTEERAEMDAWGEKTCVSVPLEFRGELIGSLDLIERRHVRRFSDEEREALRRLAVPVAIALHNARTSRAQLERSRRLSSLADASRAITSAAGLDDVLELVTRRAGRTLGSSQCMIYEYDAEQDATIARSLYLEPGRSSPGDDSIGTTYPLREYPSDRAILLRRQIVEEHATDETVAPDSRESMALHGEKCCLTAPLYYRDEPMGLLVLIETEHDRHFTAEEVELVQALAEQAAIAIHDARLIHRQELQNRRLVTLAEVSRAISASQSADEVLERVCSAAGAFFFEAPTEARVWLRDGRGFVPFAEPPGSGLGLRAPDRLVARMMRRREPVQNGDGRRGRRLVAPLIVNRDIHGYLDVRCRRRTRLTDDEVQAVEILVGHAAVALENTQNYDKLENMYLETVRALAAAIEAKDHYTAEHGDMLASMAIAVGRGLGLDEDELRNVRFAAVLHDIGKIGVPGRILNKPDKLTDEEFAIMAEHTIIGERIISHIDYLAPIAGVIRSAHERWDGLGYPDRLAADEIPLASRILLVCDAYHAMTSDRPYRRAMPPEMALGELRSNAGGQFDPTVVEAFLESWPEFAGGDLASAAAARATAALVN